MPSKIPAPGGDGGPLRVSNRALVPPRVVPPSRKRGAGAEPGAGAPAGRRARTGTSGDGENAAPEAAPAAVDAGNKRAGLEAGGGEGRVAVAGALAASAGGDASGYGPEWEAIASETGWSSPSEALRHKLSFPARADAKAKAEGLGQHVRRLRVAAEAALARSEGARAAAEGEAAAAASRAEELAREAAEAAARVEALEAEVTGLKREGVALTGDRDRLQQRLVTSQEALRELRADAGTTKAAAEAAGKRAEEAERRAEREGAYVAELQSYNGRLQDEARLAREEEGRAERRAAEAEAKLCAATAEAEARGTARAAEAAARAAELGARLREAEAARELSERELMAARATAAAGEARAAAAEAAARDAAARGDAAALEASSAREQAAAARGRAAGAESAVAERRAADARLDDALREEVPRLRAEREDATAEAAKERRLRLAVEKEAKALRGELAEAARAAAEGDRVRRSLHEALLDLKGKVRIFCRVRPGEGAGAVRCPSGRAPLGTRERIELEGAGTAGGASGGPGEGGAEPPVHAFEFDRVFGPASSQADVYAEVGSLVQSALDGYRVAVLAYGQTGGGKTWSMLGGRSDPGLIPRAASHVFERLGELRARGWRASLRARAVEVINDELVDLLCGFGTAPAGSASEGAGAGAGPRPTLSLDAEGEVAVSHARVLDLAGPEDLDAVLEAARSRRASASTALNAESSRSHLVITLWVEALPPTPAPGRSGGGRARAAGADPGPASAPPAGGGDEPVRGQLCLVDLAGSERLRRTAATGQRAREAAAINKSLSALGDVLAALASKAPHVPYRNSKLTHLLSGVLAAKASKVAMLVACAPERDSAPETLCTLRFAAKVNATELGVAQRAGHGPPKPAAARSAGPAKAPAPKR